MIVPATEQLEAELWCASVWSDRTGWAIAAVGHDPYLVDSKLKHRRFQQFAFEWPADRDRMLGVLLPRASTCDTYVAPLLRDAPNRRAADSAPLPGRYAWLDADEWDEDRQRVLDGLHTRVLTVESGGGPGRLQLYVDLGRELPGHIVAGVSRELAQRCSTDTYGGDTKLLRLPGTLNHKPRLRGGEPGRVRVLP